MVLSNIDEYSTTARDQRGEIVVTCKNGEFSPNVFGYLVSTWCAAGIMLFGGIMD